jgi:hypothetical protein
MFSYYFCLVIEEFGTGPGSIPLTNGSGSGSRRPKTCGSGGSGFGSRSATLVDRARIASRKNKKNIIVVLVVRRHSQIVLKIQKRENYVGFGV